MKRYLKLVLSFLGGLVLVSFIAFIYLIRFSERARKAYDNVENSKRINLGMELGEVLKIMGKPDRSYAAYFDKAQTVYFYEPPFASSSGIDVYMDSNKTVSKIILFE